MKHGLNTDNYLSVFNPCFIRGSYLLFVYFVPYVDSRFGQ